MNAAKPRILVIDDTPANLLTLGAALKNDYDLQIATSGPIGLAQALKSPPDLILLDIMMPGMDGFEVCSRLKAEPLLNTIPVVFVTALQEFESEVKGLKLGALDYITKPIQVETARQRIRNLLEQERLRQQVVAQRDRLETEIAERKQAELSLQRSQAQLLLAASVFASAREGITITDTEGTILDVNTAFTRITGYSRADVLGKKCHLLVPGQQTPEFYAQLWQQLIDQGHWSGELWNRRKDGELYAEMLNISTVRDANGQTQNYVALFSDITASKKHEQELDHIAHFDVLTGLPNRVLLADRLRQGMAQAVRRNQQLAVVFLDLDGFKAVNDAHGHEAGDQLLMTIAQRMKHALREGDTLARIGGDEFIALLVDLNDSATSIPMMQRLLEAAAQPLLHQEATLKVSASLGVTFYPQVQELGAEQLMRQADQAMYQAKMAGKNRFHLFDSVRDSGLRSHRESQERIRQALQTGELLLHYQPKVNMRTGLVIGVEALVRWQHPMFGLEAPAQFLPIIEDHPLAVELGEWVMETALTQLERWQTQGVKLPVSINVGARQLRQSDFVDRLRALLGRHPMLEPGRLELEVVETSAQEDITTVSQVIAQCSELGVGFALDDFGTGFSSLTFLKRLPVTLLKIDPSFVTVMLQTPNDLAILEGVIGLAHAFKRQVMAEGVETSAQGACLLKLGCELAQGFAIARPMPASELPGWLKAWKPDPAWNPATAA